jgi:hypothetical protein
VSSGVSSDLTNSTPSPGGCSGQRACPHAQLGIPETAHGLTLEYHQLPHGRSTHSLSSGAASRQTQTALSLWSKVKSMSIPVPDSADLAANAALKRPAPPDTHTNGAPEPVPKAAKHA